MKQSIKKLMNLKTSLLLVIVLFGLSFISGQSSSCPASSGTPGSNDYVTYTYFPGFGCVLQQANYNNGEAIYTYNSAGNLLLEVYADDPSYNNLDYTYTAGGSVLTIEKNDVTTTFVYCSSGASNCPQGYLSQEYIEISGTLVSATYYDYDSQNRTIKISSFSKEETFEYDSQSNLLQYNVSEYVRGEWVKSWINYVYDSNQKITEEKDSTGLVIKYGYENVSYTCQKIQCTNFVCTPTEECFEFYDYSVSPPTLYTCSEYIFVDSTCSYWRLKNRTIGNWVVTVNYDTDGNVISYTSGDGTSISETYTSGEVFDSNGLLVSDPFSNFFYGPNSEVSSVTVNGFDESPQVNYNYQPDSLIKDASFSDGTSEEHTYDVFGRLVKVAFSGFSSPGPVFNFFMPLLNSITGFASKITGWQTADSSEDINYYSGGDIGSSFSSEDLSNLKSEWESRNGQIRDYDDENCMTRNINGVDYVTDNGEYLPNFCSEDYVLTEYFCSGSSRTTRTVNCQYGCSGTRCLNSSESEAENKTSEICTDYDSNSSIGEEFQNSLFVKSFVSFQGWIYNDSCFNSTHVNESYCGENSLLGAMFGGDLVAKSVLKECLYGCYNDACLISPGNCSDGLRNGLEIGVDCGGSCPNNNCCSNGFADTDLGEIGLDCGGICELDCCLNGILDGDAGEEGVDCGGNCIRHCIELPNIEPVKPGTR